MGGVVELTDEEREALVERVLVGMAQGKTLKETVEERNLLVVGAKYGRKGCVLPGTVREWVVGREDWFTRYQKTRRLMGQAFAEEAIQVARESTSSTTAMDRVLIETLKWAAAKTNPAEYGEKTTVEHQGAPVLQVKIVEDDVPVRNEQALKAGTGVAITAAEPLLLSAPIYLPETGNPGRTGESDWDAPEQSPQEAPHHKKRKGTS
jgi:hypothetical protein